jgi:hypothetical protein
MSSRISSPWDVPVENLLMQIRQFLPSTQDTFTEDKLRPRLKRALEQAYTRGRQDGERMEREYPRSKATP